MATTETTPYRIDVEDALAVWDKVCGPISDQFALTPGQAIQRYNATHQHPLERALLPDWTAFEHGHIDWDHNDFARLLGLHDIPVAVPLILVTDEGLREKCAFRFLSQEFQTLVSRYEETYCMDFFQSADYLIFDELLRYVRILHHEGAVFRN